MHPLFGPRERVKRANHQIVALQRSFKGFFNENPYEIAVAEFNRKTSDYSLRVKSGPQEFPIDWPLLIGEIGHNLRAALDGLTWQLALRTTTTPHNRTAFPIYLIGRVNVRRPGVRIPASFWGKGCARVLLRSVPRHLWTRIESFQPFKRGNGGRHSPLFLLGQMNNTDKHRLLTVLVVSPATMTFTGFSGGTELKLEVPMRRSGACGMFHRKPRAAVISTFLARRRGS